jgi:hypothetical protein
MKPSIRINFAAFWPGFHPDHFRRFFPYVFDKYDLMLSPDPEVVFYSVYSQQFVPYADPRLHPPVTRIKPGKFVRVFLTGENFEPDMSSCEFAMTFSSLCNHENHLRLPLWVYENRAWGFGPEDLIKRADTDWEKVAAEKTRFCNFVYLHPVPFRDTIFSALNTYKPVDSAGGHLNSMNGWTVPTTPSRVAGKIEFFRRYKFTLAIENSIWPGYMTEKLVDPMFAHSIPIYVGDPQAQLSFDTSSYVDIARFLDLKQMFEFVREVDNDRALYLKMLVAPNYRDNAIPDYARDARTLAFFDRIFAAAVARRSVSAT